MIWQQRSGENNRLQQQYRKNRDMWRSKPSIDVEGMTEYITIGGTAPVSTIIAGSSSGAVENADVE